MRVMAKYGYKTGKLDRCLRSRPRMATACAPYGAAEIAIQALRARRGPAPATGRRRPLALGDLRAGARLMLALSVLPLAQSRLHELPHVTWSGGRGDLHAGRSRPLRGPAGAIRCSAQALATR